jgi:hypothetical protein
VVRCGKATDSSGKCGAQCASERLSAPWSEADDKMCGWAPAHFGAELQRLTAYQTTYHDLWYNEIIIDAAKWRAHLPECVEAVFGSRGHHEQFLAAFGLTEETHPFLEIDLHDWDTPVKAGTLATG